MKELRKRGMTPTSLLEETDRSVKDEELDLKEEEGGYAKRNAVSTDYEKSLSNQRERSMALNSEGLEVDSYFLCNAYQYVIVMYHYGIVGGLKVYISAVLVHIGSTIYCCFPCLLEKLKCKVI